MPKSEPRSGKLSARPLKREPLEWPHDPLAIRF